VGARARQVQPFEQEGVPGLTEQRTPREELVQRRLGVLDVTTGQPVGRLHVGWRDHLARLDQLAESRRDSPRAP
jgi:hypothetical protein